jgi:hypothetical protein
MPDDALLHPADKALGLLFFGIALMRFRRVLVQIQA